MKKYFTFFFCLAVSILFSYSQTLEIEDKTYQVDTLKNHSVGPGTHFTSLLQTETLTASGNLAHFTRIALPTGLYLLKITCGPRTETVKLIVSSAK
jgi:hypothetical protein